MCSAKLLIKIYVNNYIIITYLTPNSMLIFSTESYELNDQTANSGGIAGISVVHDQSFSKYCTNYN